jgi:hypothetical protein
MVGQRSAAGMCRARNQDWLTFQSAVSGALGDDRHPAQRQSREDERPGTTVLDSLLTVSNQMIVYHEMVVYYEVRANFHISR